MPLKPQNPSYLVGHPVHSRRGGSPHFLRYPPPPSFLRMLNLMEKAGTWHSSAVQGYIRFPGRERIISVDLNRSLYYPVSGVYFYLAPWEGWSLVCIRISLLWVLMERVWRNLFPYPLTEWFCPGSHSHSFKPNCSFHVRMRLFEVVITAPSFGEDLRCPFEWF